MLQEIRDEIERTFATLKALEEKKKEQEKLQKLGQVRDCMMSELKEKMDISQRKEAEIRKIEEIKQMEEGEIDFDD